MGLFNKLKMGTGFGMIGCGLYSTLFPYKTMNFLDNYLEFLPEGEALGIPYKSMIGVGVGVASMIGGVVLLTDL